MFLLSVDVCGGASGGGCFQHLITRSIFPKWRRVKGDRQSLCCLRASDSLYTQGRVIGVNENYLSLTIERSSQSLYNIAV